MTDLDHEHIDMKQVPDMTFSSSPVEYPPSSSPAPASIQTVAPKQKQQQKRRLFQTLSAQESISKRPRLSEEREREKEVIRVVEDAEGIRNPFDEEEVDHARPISPSNTSNLDLHRQHSTEAEDIDDIIPSTSYIHPTNLSNPNLGRGLTKKTLTLQTSTGQTLSLPIRKRQPLQTYESIIADRSVTKEGRAKRAYYGIEIHGLIDEARVQAELDAAAREVELQKQQIEDEVRPSIERPQSSHNDHNHAKTQERQKQKHQMWTEKYRAKKFTELVGDERTHRSVLKWLKAWDPIVFPGSLKQKPVKRIYEDKDATSEYQHRKIMLLTGPPGLGKTTLAHVCARQAGYEVLEINASDDRSRDVVKGRIKDAVGTETVRGIKETGKSRKAGRPVCVVVDEVDGVVTGSGGGGGGEGGFMKALIDLVQLDQRNSAQSMESNSTMKKGKKGDRFRLLRPLILICNDVYAPSLRPLRQSSIAEIVHVRKPPIEKVISRLRTVFEKENIPCDNDAVRRLCEDAWGLGSRKQNAPGTRGSGDGDIRGVLVQGEWMAHKLRLQDSDGKLTRKWVEEQINSSAAKGPKGLGRDGAREIIERVFVEGAGLPTANLLSTMSADDARLIRQSKGAPIGVSDLRKRSAVDALREMIDTSGDHDRLMTDCFATYGTRVYQDDTFLSKPNRSYDWLHFHDTLSGRVHSAQEWELTPYLSTGVCAFHDLFASTDKGSSAWHTENDKQDGEEAAHPFSGPRADFAAYESEKVNRTMLSEIQGNFSAELLRVFSSTEDIAMELIPAVSRILSPDVKPVVVGGSGGNAAVASVRKESEKSCVRSAVRVMNAISIAFEKVKIESEGYGSTINGGFALRMEP